MWWVNGYGGWTREGAKDPPVLRFLDVPPRTGPTRGVYAAQGYQANLCIVIHTLNSAGHEVRANMVVVRTSLGVAPDGHHSTPGKFTSDEYNHFLKMLGDAILPKAVP